jgi:hypothetical protein
MHTPSATLRSTVALYLVLGGLAACATPKVAPSGFLGSYQNLAASEETGAVQVYIPDAARLAQYSSIQIADPVMMEARLKPEDDATMRKTLMDSLAEALAVEREIVAAPGAGTLLLRYAIVEVNTSNVALNVVTTALIGAVDYGSLALEVEVMDSVSNERLAAMTWARGAKPLNVTGAYSTIGNARALAPEFARRVASLVSRTNAN